MKQEIPALVLMCVAGCATPSPMVDSIVYEDGINQEEARNLASDYLRKHMEASFGSIGPYDGTNVWIFKITGDVVPVDLTNVPPVRVDKKTGSISWEAQAPLNNE